MVLLQPEDGAAQQKAADFVASVIENVAVPVLVDAFARIRMLVQMCAIEVAKRPIIGRKV